MQNLNGICRKGVVKGLDANVAGIVRDVIIFYCLKLDMLNIWNHMSDSLLIQCHLHDQVIIFL